MFQTPENYRYRRQGTGNSGVFKIPLSHGTAAMCIASDEWGWEHVSVTITSNTYRGKDKMRTPTWAEMCKIKNIFWDQGDTVRQYHPPKSDYVNNHKFCLHLWRPVNVKFPRPPKIIGLVN